MPTLPIRRTAAGHRAIILAGGKGTRLLPFTVNFPKPLMPLGDLPVIEVLMRQLVRYGITDITLTLGHLAELLKAYFAQQHPRNDLVTLRYVQEAEPTGTAGSLAMIADLTETFLVMNGDLLTDLDFDALMEHHYAHGAALTIATHTRQVKIDLGVLEFDDAQRITTYREKPESEYHVSMGIYVYSPTVLRFITPGEYLDFPALVWRLLDAGELVSAYPTDCLWLDIGRPDDYARAQELYTSKREAFDYV